MKRTTAGRIFSVEQVSVMCHVSRETVRRWIRKHGLAAYNTSHGMNVRILESDLREFATRLNVYVDWAVMDDDPTPPCSGSCR